MKSGKVAKKRGRKSNAERAKIKAMENNQIEQSASIPISYSMENPIQKQLAK